MSLIVVSSFGAHGSGLACTLNRSTGKELEAGMQTEESQPDEGDPASKNNEGVPAFFFPLMLCNRLEDDKW